MALLISIIIPVYNTQDYLTRCLDSVLNSTYKEIEIICIDDGSTDGSGDVLDRYAEIDSRIRVVHQANKGVSAARNEGIRQATGKYVFFLDSDDYVHRSCFELLARITSKRNADIVCGGVCKGEMDPNGELIFCEKEIRKIQETEIPEDKYLLVYVTARLIRKQIATDIMFDETVRIAEDRVFNYRLMERYSNSVILEVPTVLYCYYQRAGSILNGEKHSSGERIQLIDYYLKRYQEVEKPLSQRIYLEESVKQILRARYECSIRSISSFDKQLRVQARSCREYLWHAPCFSKKKKLVYWLFLKCSTLYRVYRIKTDPTMLEYEHRIKNIQNNH